MRNFKVRLISTIIILLLIMYGTTLSSNATDKKEILNGKSYDLGEKDAYDLSKRIEVEDDATGRLLIQGDITSVSNKDGFDSYEVNSGNLKILVNTDFRSDLFEYSNDQNWHIVTDKTKVVDSVSLTNNIGSGAIIVQTSKDGKSWVTVDNETDIYNKMDSINNRSFCGDEIGAFYETTNVQMSNGCYYRIIVAYKLTREIDPSQFLFVEIGNSENKEHVEIYEFYACDSTVNHSEVLDITKSYEFSDVYRVDGTDGFKNPTLIKSDDPHIDWKVGRFYVSGYTDVRMDGDVPVFLKVPGDKTALWFNLEQELDKCNGRTDVKVNYIDSGSDIEFGTPTIKDFGKGALIVRKTDKQNQKDREIYTNYLEASATVGANTRVDLFEEGDYEVALDYQLHYDQPFVFGTTTTKTLTYRIYFKFKVRNGDISVFLRDKNTYQFIDSGNIAERGFYIDVANSQYLSMSIKREVLTDSLDGLVEDTKFTAVAKEGRFYTEEGLYTVTVTNLATGDTVEKKVYVGNKDIMLAYMTTGLSFDEINERIAEGAYVDSSGQLVYPEFEVEDITSENEEVTAVNIIDNELSTSDAIEMINDDVSVSDDSISNNQNLSPNNDMFKNGYLIIAVVVVLVLAGGVIGRKKSDGSKEENK